MFYSKKVFYLCKSSLKLSGDILHPGSNPGISTIGNYGYTIAGR